MVDFRLIIRQRRAGKKHTVYGVDSAIVMFCLPALLFWASVAPPSGCICKPVHFPIAPCPSRPAFRVILDQGLCH